MISVEPFAQNHIEDAAKLFISSYKKQRIGMGCLPLKYEKIETITPLLEAILKTHPGVVAISEGGLVGYLVGFARIPHFKGISPGVYVPEWAHSAISGPEKERVFQEMYDAISQDWVGDGCFTHAISFFATDTKLRHLLYWSGFGFLVVDALRTIQQDDEAKRNEPGSKILIRQANEDDLGELARLDNELVTYLSRSPTFLFAERDKESEIAEEFLGENLLSVVAVRGPRVLACIRGTEQKENSCAIVQDKHIMGIDFAYTEPDVRGTGIGRRVLGEILKWGESKRKAGCAVDFESANVLGRTFWLKHFRAVCFSAIRHVDPRVVRSWQN